MEIKSRIFFAEEKIKSSLEKLKEGDIQDKELYLKLIRAFEDLSQNAFYGIQIPKKLIPKDYISKYGVTNLWKYNLPNAWRLIYSIANEKVQVVSIIIEWFDHKTYERKFNY